MIMTYLATMKKLFSFLVLSWFLIILFFQSFMMTFATGKMSHREMNSSVHHSNIEECLWEKYLDDKENQDCEHQCCYQSSTAWNFNIVQPKRESKEQLKYKNYIDIFTLSVASTENKSLVHIHSPPYLSRKIKNYAYIHLIKIIKSNT